MDMGDKEEIVVSVIVDITENVTLRDQQRAITNSITGGVVAFFFGGNFGTRFLNHRCQFCFAFFMGMCIYIPGNVLALGISWGVFALPKVVV